MSMPASLSITSETLNSPKTGRRSLWKWLVANRGLLLIALPALMLIWLPYRIGYNRMWWRAESPEAYQAIIPLGALTLAYVRWPWLLTFLQSRDSNLSTAPGNPLLLLSGGALWLLNHLWRFQELSALSLVALAAGTVYYLYGLRGLQAMSTPLLFLLLMAPLPRLGIANLSEMLQINTTYAAGTALQNLGAPVEIIGNSLIFPHYRLEVTQACGGAGILLGLLVLTLWMLGMMQSNRFQQTMMIAAVIVLEVPLNILRVMVMGFLALRVPALASTLHDANSWMFTLLLFWLMFRLSHAIGVRTLWRFPQHELDRQKMMLQFAGDHV